MLPWFLALAAAASEPLLRSFHLPAGPAAETLKRFAEQAQREILFPAQLVEGIRTQAVEARLAPRAALERMLRDTGLVAVEETGTGALLITRPGRPAAPSPASAAPTPPADDPMKRPTFLALLSGWFGLASPAGVGQPAAVRPAASLGAPSAVVSGRVSNEGTGSYLPGAIVTLDGTDLAALTERDGSYRLPVPAGTHTLIASYSGLEPQRATVTVGAGATVARDFALTAQIYRLARMVVSSEREGNALALTLQRQADNVKNVISADAFGSLAGNPGELLQRVPGVVAEHVGGDIRYLSIRGINPDLSAIQIDGNRSASISTDRRAWFENLNADPIESMEVIKAATPDLEADSIGGTINLKSRSAFDLKGRRLSYSLGGTVAVGRDHPHPAGTLSYSDVLGRDQRLGISFSAGYREYLAVMEETTHDFQATETSPAYQWRLESIDRENLRGRWGGGLRLDYRLSDAATVFANVTYAPNSEDNFVITHRIATGQTVATLDAAGNPTGPNAILPNFTDTRTEARPVAASIAEIVNLHRERTASVTTAQIGGRVRRPAWELDYDASYSVGEHFDHFNRVTVTARNIGWVLERRGDARWTPTVTQTSGPDIANLDSYTGNVFDSVRPDVKNTIAGAQLNVRRNFALPVPSYVKAGARIRHEESRRANHDRRWSFAGPDGVVGTADDRLGQFRDPDYNIGHYHGFYAPRPIPDVDAMAGHLRANPGLWREDTAYALTQTLANDLFAEEDVRAAYLLGHTRLPGLSLLAGVRVEDTTVAGEGPVVRLTAEERARRTAWVGPVTEAENLRRIRAERGGREAQSNDYRHVFPSVHFKYEPRPGLVGRLSYSTGIGRPNFNAITPNLNVNEDTRTVVANNPGIRPQYSDNFDASLEYYFEPVGLLSAGVFLKEISDFMFTAGGTTIATGADNGFGGEYAGFNLQTQHNGGAARVRGFELNYQQQLTFLPGWLKGFGVLANYTRLETRGDYGTIGSTRSSLEITGFTPSTANAGVSYILGRYNLRVAYNYKDRKLMAFSAQESRRRYETASRRVDLKLRYLVTRTFDVYLDLYNVFNEKQGEVWGLNRPRYLRDRHDPQIHFGCNGRF